MKIRWKAFAMAGIIGVLAPACMAGEGLPKEVVVALKPDKDPDRMLEERKTLAAALEAEIGRPVRVVVPTSASVILEGLANGSMDVGYLSATDMVNARRAGAADVLLIGEINGKREYRSLWLGLASSPYASVGDLKGKRVAFSGRTSTSGFLIPLLDLKQKGLITRTPEEFFGQVWYGSGYLSAVERVLAGEADAAAVSDYVFEKDKHLRPEQKALLKVVASQGPVPTHVLAVAARLDEASRERLRAAFQNLEQTAPTVGEAVFGSKFVVAPADEHLLPVEEALSILETR